MGLTEVAILAKTPKRGHGRLSTSSLVKIVEAAIQAAPQEANDIVQMALTLHPEAAGRAQRAAHESSLESVQPGWQRPGRFPQPDG